jgi:choline dehydrogenase-like flavoprotein
MCGETISPTGREYVKAFSCSDENSEPRYDKVIHSLRGMARSGDPQFAQLKHARKSNRRFQAKQPPRARANLEIRGKALVDRVVIKDGQAIGVRVHIDGQAPTEIRGREIVLCAGAIDSPAILMRSGIGPADDLKSMGIAVERDLPVGRHFFDHPLFRATFSFVRTFAPPTRIRATPIVA